MGKDCAEFAMLRAALRKIVRESVNLDSMFKNVYEVDDNPVCDDYIKPKISSIDVMVRVKYFSRDLLVVDIVGKDSDYFSLVPFVEELKYKMKKGFRGLEVVTAYSYDSIDTLDSIIGYACRN